MTILQKKEMNRLNATRLYREYQLEQANQKMQEAESATNSFIEQAHQKQQQSEELDKAISEKRSKLNKEKGSELLSAAGPVPGPMPGIGGGSAPIQRTNFTPTVHKLRPRSRSFSALTSGMDLSVKAQALSEGRCVLSFNFATV